MALKQGLLVLLFMTLVVAMLAESSFSHLDATHATARVGDMLYGEEETLMPSDVARRTLGEKYGYISYEAMSANNIPCDRRGQSYYQCTRMERANPYRRGCQQISRCRRGS